MRKKVDDGEADNVVARGFVYLDEDIGIGKITSIIERSATVELFHSAAQVETVVVPTRGLRRATLMRQTRVYVHDADDRWRMGRVVHVSEARGGAREYEVIFPNGGVEYLDEEALSVRCWTRASEPGEALAAGGGDTQYFHDRRLALQTELVRARAASRGLSGLTSASVDLVRHQVGAVRRILEDGVQRYLLADEVGLGKTIEAGVVIRQALLDDRSVRVAVFVPEPLVGQWRSELLGKFGTAEFPERLSVSGHEVLLGHRDLGEFQLAVVDEVHNLVSGDEARYSRLTSRLGTAPHLLLLSATPDLGDARTMLRVLHLLDPAAHPLDRPEEFAAKFAKVQDYGRVLLGLRPGLTGMMVRRATTQLLDLFPSDGVVRGLVGSMRDADADGRRPAVDEAAARIKTYVADTYRLHQRIVRGRRSATQGWEFPTGVRRSTRPWLMEESSEDDRLTMMADWLEQWRLASHRAWSTSDEPARELLIEEGASAYGHMLEALGQGAVELSRAVSDRMASLRDGIPFFSDEPDLLADAAALLAQDPGDRDDATVVAESIAAMHAQSGSRDGFKVVVFCSSAGRSSWMARRLGEIYGSGRIAHITSSSSEEEVSLAVDGFRDQAAIVAFVCDRSGEEGLNLTFADAVFHLDLPLSPARVEQRIGRLDRLGRSRGTIRQRVLTPPDEADTGPYAAWLRLLVEGFGVFDGSVSDVQALLDRVGPEIARTIYLEGGEGLVATVQALRGRLADERRRIAEQHALDELTDADDEDAALLFEGMEEAEAEEAVFADAVDGWMVGALGLLKHPVRSSPKAFRYEWHDRVLAPAWPWRRELADALDRPLTFSRHLAAGRPGLCLLRPGAGPVVGIERLLRWDDRGSAFATWRHEPTWPGGPGEEWIGFRVCVVLEADLPEPDRRLGGLVAGSPASRRRADGLFPPRMRTLHLDSDLRPVSDPRLLGILELPYRASRDEGSGGRDYNLGSRQRSLDLVLEERRRSELCRAAGPAAVRLALSDEVLREELAETCRRAASRLGASDERLRRRLAARGWSTHGDHAQELERQLKENAVLRRAVTSPRARVDAVGLFVVASYAPEAVGRR